MGTFVAKHVINAILGIATIEPTARCFRRDALHNALITFSQLAKSIATRPVQVDVLRTCDALITCRRYTVSTHATDALQLGSDDARWFPVALHPCCFASSPSHRNTRPDTSWHVLHLYVVSNGFAC
jgi:hypothetical protein